MYRRCHDSTLHEVLDDILSKPADPPEEAVEENDPGKAPAKSPTAKGQPRKGGCDRLLSQPRWKGHQLLSSCFDFSIPSTAQGHLRTKHTFRILLHQFRRQVIKSQVCLIHCYNVVMMWGCPQMSGWHVRDKIASKTNHLFIYQCTPTHVLVPVYIPVALTMGTCWNRLWLWAGWPILFCRPTQETALAETNTVKM